MGRRDCSACLVGRAFDNLRSGSRNYEGYAINEKGWVGKKTQDDDGDEMRRGGSLASQDGVKISMMIGQVVLPVSKDDTI